MAGPAGATPVVPPNQTLYITNIPSAKFQKSDIRTALYMLFSTYGPVLDVVALKTIKMRGQAHVVYRDIQTATQAMRALNGTQFFGREMKIMYAKSKSDIISKLDGSFKMAPVGAGPGASGVQVTDIQRSIFNAPAPGTDSTAGAGAGAGAPTTSSSSGVMPLKPPAAAKDADASAEGRGQKRPREEDDDDDSDGDVAMEEDSSDSD